MMHSHATIMLDEYEYPKMLKIYIDFINKFII